MGHRSIIWLLSALLSVSASHVLALGLGGVKLNSALNQPLDAEIELYEVKGLEQQEIKVKIASAEDFQRIGVDRPYFLSDLTFSVVLKGPGAPMIKVRSNKIVREPFLNFVLHVQWPSGKLLREYTLLLDLPTYSGQTASPVAPVRSQTQTQAQSGTQTKKSPAPADSGYNPRSTYQEAPPRPAAAQVSPSITGDSYTTQANDTLWEIAAAVRPDADVTIHQTMIAIQRNNPDAFIKNNINLLKKGQVLRIPDKEDIASTGKQAAIREVAIQNSEWSGRKASDADTGAEAQLSTTQSYDDATKLPETITGRVKLTAPDDSYNSAEGRTTGSAGAASTEALENELASTLEQLDKSGRENNELRSKVASLEEQIKTMERMLEVSSENLRALELSAKKNAELEEQQAANQEQQRQLEELKAQAEEALKQETLKQEALKQEQEAAEQQAVQETAQAEEKKTQKLSDIYDELAKGNKATSGDDAKQNEATAEESGTEQSAALDAESTPEVTAEATPETTPETSPESTPAATATPAAKSVAAAPAPAEKSLVDLLIDNILYIAVGLVVLLGGVFVLMRKKAKEDEEFADFADEENLDDSSDGQTRLHYRDAPEHDDAGGFADDQEREQAPSLDDFEPQDDVAAESEITTTDPQTEDVVAEADIYIAYGKFDQAAEMLLKVLAKDPSDENVRLKLLEVYSAQQDVGSFDPHYSKLLAGASRATIDRADSLRRNIIGAPPYNDDFSADADLSLDDTVLAAKPAGKADDDFGDELSLDLDLGDIDSDGNPDNDLDFAPVQEKKSAASRDDDLEIVDDGDDASLDLDFDLGDLDLDAKVSDDDDKDSDVDFDLGDIRSGAADDLDDLDDLNDAFKPSVMSSSNKASSSSLDDDLSDFNFESGGSDLSEDDLDADLASLDADLGTLDSDFADLDFGDSSASSKSSDKGASSSSDESEFDLAADLADLPDFDDLDTELSSDKSKSDKSQYSSDTVVNEALNDDYLEQKLSEEADFDLSLDNALSLEDSAPAKAGKDSAALADEEDGDLDLSSLDKALDDLASDLDGLSDEDLPTLSMDEPVTDFDDFDDELEKDEAMAETVKSNAAVSEAEIENMGEDTMFRQAIREVPAAKEADLEFELPEVSAEDMGDDDLDFLSDSDETATKLDLARAYIDMGDQDGAREIILEVLSEGNEQQKNEATALMERLNA